MDEESNKRYSETASANNLLAETHLAHAFHEN
jgi:hypothetical protein